MTRTAQRLMHGLVVLVLGLLASACGDEPGDASMVTDSHPEHDSAPAGSPADSRPVDSHSAASDATPSPAPAGKRDVATLGAGCFWCVEAVFSELKGVHSVVSGYMGGHVENPTYARVCSKTTGHAEVARIEYDPAVIRFEELLEVFWKTHDPTTLDRQGNDVGPQYRSAVFYHSDEQKKVAEAYRTQLDASGAFAAPIVTEITKAGVFYAAEDDHQEYFRLNPNQGYCRAVVRPKVEKFRKAFAAKLKDAAPRQAK